MRILLTGAEGQLGSTLQEPAPAGTELLATDVHNLDLCDPQAVAAGLQKMRPELIINAAAYTAVDQAESEARLAQRINEDAVKLLSDWCSANGSRLLHLSTDFVFGGQQNAPCRPDESPMPQSVYGKTKLAGEQALLGSNCDGRILRTSWLYSQHGNNFVKTMLRLGADREQLSIVSDQTGSPTYARNLANAIWQLVHLWPASPILHYADSGETSWYGFAQAIFDEAAAAGLLQRSPQLIPVSSSDYGAPAPRPAYSVLDTSLTQTELGIAPPQWRSALREMLRKLATEHAKSE
jgi:dTDP-4-dehydrorhamnose reductase